jgi:hypothetical protein
MRRSDSRGLGSGEKDLPKAKAECAGRHTSQLLPGVSVVVAMDSLAPARSALWACCLRQHSFRLFPKGSSVASRPSSVPIRSGLRRMDAPGLPRLRDWVVRPLHMVRLFPFFLLLILSGCAHTPSLSGRQKVTQEVINRYLVGSPADVLENDLHLSRYPYDPIPNLPYNQQDGWYHLPEGDVVVSVHIPDSGKAVLSAIPSILERDFKK